MRVVPAFCRPADEVFFSPQCRLHCSGHLQLCSQRAQNPSLLAFLVSSIERLIPSTLVVAECRRGAMEKHTTMNCHGIERHGHNLHVRRRAFCLFLKETKSKALLSYVRRRARYWEKTRRLHSTFPGVELLYSV